MGQRARPTPHSRPAISGLKNEYKTITRVKKVLNKNAAIKGFSAKTKS